ncbi:glycosyltransferase [Microbacterium sp. BK668]|uniref:glycosyltransferase n=1 Tax=Microbacterium sp. BK668 TaxID=2512118 RepID=UPI00105FF166|nr:glycosyltransferase [Microbacterium sp. BK668]
MAADVVGRHMAGPGIRVVAIARQLCAVADVTLAVGTTESELSVFADDDFDVVGYTSSEQLLALVTASDIAFCQFTDADVVRRALATGTRFIFDLYNALPAETIGAERIGGFTTQPEMDDVFRDLLAFFRLCVKAGSYFVTSNERQRDFWVGYLLSAGALLPSDLGGRTVEDIIGLVPFGMPEGEPHAAEHALRGTSGIAEDDVILLWAGGIWDWFDAETPIRAVAELRRTRPDIRLVFYGTTHPNPVVGRPRTVDRAIALADRLGVLDDGVHFVDGWVPADQRASFLLDADIAVSAHKASFETRYAFRTRILDHFWASLPSVVTEGDWFADYIGVHGLGEVVGYGDVEAVKTAILELTDAAVRDAIRENIRGIRENWRWSVTTRDLVTAVENWESVLVPRRLDDPVPPVPSPPGPVPRGVRARLSGTVVGRLYRGLRRRAAGAYHRLRDGVGL